MWFTDPIFSLVYDIADFFWYLYYESRDIPLVGSVISGIFLDIYFAIQNLLTPIANLGEWLDSLWLAIQTKVDETTFNSFVMNVAIDRFLIQYFWGNRVAIFLEIIGDWWDSIDITIPDIWADITAWTTTQLNNLSNTFNTLIIDVKSWTTSQVNSARDFLITLLGNLEHWTRTQVNTLQATLTTLIDWTNLTVWIANWWDDKLLDIEAMLNTRLLLWFPFYDELASLWSSIREFFVDPEQYVYDKLDNWFERFW